MGRRDFLLLAALAAAAAFVMAGFGQAAFGQAVTPAAGPAGSTAQSAAFIPDFSGIWSHPYLPRGTGSKGVIGRRHPRTNCSMSDFGCISAALAEISQCIQNEPRELISFAGPVGFKLTL
jgi:hypothetical protein